MKKIIATGLLSCSLLLSGFVSGHKTEAATVGVTATNVALHYIGVPYVWGGTTPRGFDCSGFIDYSYKQSGVSLPRTTGELYNRGESVSRSNLREGDLVFFTTYTSGPSHVGIYISNNQFVHASDSGVKVDSLSNSYYNSRFYGARRIDNASYDGWVLSGGTWYYYNKGQMKTGWLKDAGKWYLLGPNGAMATGWVSWCGKWYYLNHSGEMVTGWVKVSNKWYYLYSDGSMAKSTKIQGYVLGSDGAWIK